MPNNENQGPMCKTCVFLSRRGEVEGRCHLEPPDATGDLPLITDAEKAVGCKSWTPLNTWLANIEFVALRTEYEADQVNTALEQARRAGSSLSAAMMMMPPNMMR